MVADVVSTYNLFEIVAAQYCINLLVNARENDGDALLLTHQTHVLQIVQSGGVDEGNLTHTDNAHLGTAAVACHDILEAVAGTKEVGTVNLVDLDTFRNGEVLQVATLHVCILVEVYLVEYGMDIGGLCHAAHEEQTGTDESELNSHGEIEDDGEEESEQQHGNIALGIAQHSQE